MYTNVGSGWILHSLQSLETVAWSLDSLQASANHQFPECIRHKNDVLNLKSPGFKYFKWAFLAGMHPTTHNSSRLSKYQQFEGLYDFNTLTYPVTLKDIDRFCNVNNCYINVYGIANGEKDGNLNKLDGELDITLLYSTWLSLGSSSENAASAIGVNYSI